MHAPCKQHASAMIVYCTYYLKVLQISFLFSVMDFTTDTTDIMDRKGNIYPLAKAAGLGYGIGHKKMVWEEDGDMQGCCTAQIGKSTF